ncbi:lytic murein transglycosylase B [Inmirania thermothiophila]|uniref:Membrane-bound lytic murein transglycosylase B n=1 Tax=Inmirania thermothiophila TaxID=1750597 RepID=A0A3N1Y788_9GAMM|nr:lytic murein transglycosylase B [Inmirania thermothiophila]ROR34686.1 membrane-bound lytic murein transglycosylase B [Inmirania thermothiophila]
MARRSLAAVLLLAAAGAGAAPAEFPGLETFLERMVREHGFDRDRLAALFAGVRLEQRILDAIARPAEARPWRDYRPIFVNEARIEEGARFWAANRGLLGEVEARYGVDPAVVVAILGVETRYGRHRGGYRVLDALSTLAFAWPPRAAFFRRELEQFLLLARETGIDPAAVTGSYAGAMGPPQFIPSSYRRYAVDFDGDGDRDLWSLPDALGSIGNYLARHGWRRGGPVAMPVRVTGDFASLLDPDLHLARSAGALRRAGVEPLGAVDDDEPAALILLAGEAQPVLVFTNFRVITRYNRSPLYAMAVHELAEAVRGRLQRQARR